jgi:hypothetical protein
MASGTRLPNSDEGMTTTLKTRRVRTLPARPGSIVYFATPDLVVVADKPEGGGGGGGSGGGATIDVCNCVQMQFQCTSDGHGHTTCKEQCVEWECTTLPEAP